ncbi:MULTISPECIES: NAD(P)-dependent oxidoreductase [unclassified Streptomyces]|uniref:NAD(P)-dependent oxidoreductase n=1 Tax=Streptomyces sp. NBC_00060 TaxID=2975636 RepID=A0AAU2H339_9ACTN
MNTETTKTNVQRVAFLGLGNMGAPMARRLLAAGHGLTVWNRTASKAEALVAEGAVAAATPAEAVREADVVITMLADPAAALAVADAVVPALRAGTTWIDTSTVGPDTVRELASRLPDGVAFIDAPVMGSVDRAATGELLILAGGETASVDGLLAELGSVTRCGEVGTGAALKLVLISAVIGGVALVAESLRLATALGLPASLTRSALAASPMGPLVGRAFATEAHFPVELAAKDVALATGVGGLPVLEAVREVLVGRGDLAGADLSSLRD